MNRALKPVNKEPTTHMSLRGKRKAEVSVSPTKTNKATDATTKRSAFGVITNKTATAGSNIPVVKGSKTTNGTMIPLKASNKNSENKRPSTTGTLKNLKGKAAAAGTENENILAEKTGGKNDENVTIIGSVILKKALGERKDSSLKNNAKNETVESNNRKNLRKTDETKSRLPEGVVDIDAEAMDDQYQVALYVCDIFEYYKYREPKFGVTKYLETQTELNPLMRSILVDWMVEVQENFELNHETLYLAVKLVDMYLSKVPKIARTKLQLIGATALFLAAKYDEKSPPVIDDFCYICDDAYPQKDVLHMEIQMLKTLQYDIGAPLSYRFLRRYGRVAKLEMETLTLARYILEMSLADYEFIDVSGSLMAAACLLLALKINGVENPWTPTLAYYSGYKKDDIADLCHRLLKMIKSPGNTTKTIQAKYSHKVFYEVAKIPLPAELKL